MKGVHANEKTRHLEDGITKPGVGEIVRAAVLVPKWKGFDGASISPPGNGPC